MKYYAARFGIAYEYSLDSEYSAFSSHYTTSSEMIARHSDVPNSQTSTVDDDRIVHTYYEKFVYLAYSTGRMVNLQPYYIPAGGVMSLTLSLWGCSPDSTGVVVEVKEVDSATSDNIYIPIPTWTWSGCNGLATESQIATGYNALTNHGALSDFSYLIWNDMVYKADNILKVCGIDWDTNSWYDIFSNTVMSDSDKTLTAVRWNSLYDTFMYNVYFLYLKNYVDISDGIATKGQIVKGSIFTDLTDKINEAITSLNSTMETKYNS